MKDKERFLIIGAGAVGSTLALALADRAEVVLADSRPELLAPWRARGFEVVEPEGLAGLARGDLTAAILATRATVACAAARPIPQGLPLISLSNGLNPALAAERGGELVPGVVDFAASLAGPGEPRCTWRGGLVLPRDSYGGAALRLARALRGSEVRVRLARSIEGHLWSKLLLNSSLDAAAGVTAQTFGEVFLHPGSLLLFRALLREGLAALGAAGIETLAIQGVGLATIDRVLRLPVISRIAALIGGRRALPVESVLLGDLRRGLRTEIDHLNVQLIRVADRVGIPVPTHRRAVALIREMEAGRRSPGRWNLEAFQDFPDGQRSDVGCRMSDVESVTEEKSG